MSITKERQDPLIQEYVETPEFAVIVDTARTRGGSTSDPFHGKVLIGQTHNAVEFDYGIHRAVGGFGDLPNPGDMLCGALAACLDSTIRIICNRLGVEITDLRVAVEGEVDVRGSLKIDETVPVGFQRLQVAIEIAPLEELNRALLKRLVRAAEKSCVTLQSFSANTEVDTNISITKTSEFDTLKSIEIDPVCTSEIR